MVLQLSAPRVFYPASSNPASCIVCILHLHYLTSALCPLTPAARHPESWLNRAPRMSTVGGDDMNPKDFARLAGRLMSCPAAPFHEAGVRGVAESICAENGLVCKRDAFGNVIVRLGHALDGRALALAAHLDHPGFEVVQSLGERQWVARFHGGVPDGYFRRGTPLRLLPGCTAAKLGRRLGQEKRFEVRT